MTWPQRAQGNDDPNRAQGKDDHKRDERFCNASDVGSQHGRTRFLLVSPTASSSDK